ncbi:lead, cadmium, zinc and mercury transporting ATPase [Candidatus Termititenax persephonae]|uniref:Lead, cadmium, zinc and mercury transporting ATPase n=1 Tax=Candidatus Termititenax persephonae TaxID=2218525 RepID=A0A388TFL3_9BACT|nr:lead, cadmium, zinc and mercury transporting ATPase [Candidatus Termititenax persephonae]
MCENCQGQKCTPAAKTPQAAAPLRLSHYGLGLGAVIFALGLLLRLPAPRPMLLFLASYLLIGGTIIWQAAKNILRGQVFDENFLMSLASLGAFAIGEYPEAVAVMLFYQIGEFFQEAAVRRSRQSIASLMDIRPDFAVLPSGQKVNPETLQVGDSIIVRPGEKIPLDGVVSAGSSALDLTALTGESLPRDVTVGSEVLSGAVNQSGLLTLRVSKPFGESTVSKILNLVQNAEQKKAPVENFITKFARYYTPGVVGAACCLAIIPPLVSGADFTDWLYRALTFLVVSCPCALVVSIPLSFFGGIGAASKNGILVKGSNFLDALNDADTVVFDKTGTLTKGIFVVTQIVPASGLTAEKLLDIAAHAELHSNHPIAVSIRQAYGKKPDRDRLTQYVEIAGQGIKIKLDGQDVLAGNTKLLAQENIPLPDPADKGQADNGTVVYLAVNKKLAGHIVISDEIKPDSPAAIAELQKIGIANIALLTGDNQATAAKIAAGLGIKNFYAELLPQEKVEQLRKISQNKRAKTIFVGDGINDAPVLAISDIGVAMGGVGSDAAIEAADIVLMTDEPSKLPSAIKIARFTRRIVQQNITLALGIKGLILLFSAAGLANMWFAVFGDVGVSFLAILNALRILSKKPA